MKRLAVFVSASSIIAFALIRFLIGPGALSLLFLWIAVVATVILLTWGYALSSKINSPKRCLYKNCMRAYILLHLFPASYLGAQFFVKITPFWNYLYLAPVMLFFWTGRLSWRDLYERFGSMMYQIFYRGNTGMLISAPLLLGLSVVYPDTFGSEIFRQLLIVYFTVHFLLTGVAVVKIDKDISARR